jgi:C-terminal processing protease CtpA/Prc
MQPSKTWLTNYQLFKYVLLIVGILTLCPTIGNTLTLQGHISNQHGRIGVYWNPWSHRVAKVHKGSPAEKAGILKNDNIIAVDGQKPGKVDIEGDAGTCVTLTIERDNQTFNVTIERIPVEQINKD